MNEDEVTLTPGSAAFGLILLIGLAVAIACLIWIGWKAALTTAVITIPASIIVGMITEARSNQ